MSKYDVSFSRLTVLLLPMCMRRPRLTAVARALTAPVALLHTELLRFRSDMHYRMTHNGQTCHLRAVLNDRFDRTLRRIRITENEDTTTSGIMLHMRVTRLFVRIPRRGMERRILYRRGYNGSQGFGFWVEVPQELYGTVRELELRAVVNKYKLASVRYGISYYNL